MVELTDKEKLEKLSNLKRKLEEMETSLETDIKNIEQRKKMVQKY